MKSLKALDAGGQAGWYVGRADALEKAIKSSDSGSAGSAGAAAGSIRTSLKELGTLDVTQTDRMLMFGRYMGRAIEDLRLASPDRDTLQDLAALSEGLAMVIEDSKQLRGPKGGVSENSEEARQAWVDSAKDTVDTGVTYNTTNSISSEHDVFRITLTDVQTLTNAHLSPDERRDMFHAAFAGAIHALPLQEEETNKGSWVHDHPDATRDVVRDMQMFARGLTMALGHLALNPNGKLNDALLDMVGTDRRDFGAQAPLK
jgi:hypothetical protein